MDQIFVPLKKSKTHSQVIFDFLPLGSRKVLQGYLTLVPPATNDLVCQSLQGKRYCHQWVVATSRPWRKPHVSSSSSKHRFIFSLHILMERAFLIDPFLRNKIPDVTRTNNQVRKSRLNEYLIFMDTLIIFCFVLACTQRYRTYYGGYHSSQTCKT